MLSFFVIASCAPSVRFSVTDDSYTTGRNTAKLKVLTDSATGSRVSVLLNGGGGVDELFLAPAADARTEGKNTSLREVIWSHGLNATSAIENPTWKGRMLLPYANRIGNASYVFNGSSYQLPVNDVAGLHNALHGLLWDRTMVPVASHADNTGASVTLAYEFNTGRPATRATGYPFKLAVRITYSLGLGENGGTSFDAEVQASNIDPTGWPLPFYNGWHPYFLCHPCSEAYIVLDKTAQWAHVDVGVGPRFPPPRYSNMVPTTHISPWRRSNGTAPIGKAASPPGAPEYLDDEVKAIRRRADANYFETTLIDGSTAQRVVLRHDSDMRYLQIFTGAMASFPTTPVDAVVLEPLSAMSDGYNNHDGLHVISAGETYVSRFGVRVEAE